MRKVLVPPVFLICEAETYWTPLFRRSMSSKPIVVIQHDQLAGMEDACLNRVLDQNVCGIGWCVTEDNAAMLWERIRSIRSSRPNVCSLILTARPLSYRLCEAGVALPVTSPLDVPAASRYIIRNANRREQIDHGSHSIRPEVRYPWFTMAAGGEIRS